nr:hypothetical protein 16 [Legionellales bacterium]
MPDLNNSFRILPDGGWDGNVYGSTSTLGSHGPHISIGLFAGGTSKDFPIKLPKNLIVPKGATLSDKERERIRDDRDEWFVKLQTAVAKKVGPILKKFDADMGKAITDAIKSVR